MDLVSEIENPCPGVLNETPAFLFLTLINSLFATQCSLKPPIFPDYNVKNGDDFDFIIVGAGAAGSVVANRLSENPNWKVLLIEAGGDPSITSQIPALSFGTGSTPEDWRFKSVPQTKIFQGIENKECIHPAGKVVGGSTTINTFLYVRGNKRDFDNWEKLGNVGWDFKNVLKHFKKSQNNLEFGNNKKYHSTGGYLNVEFFRNGTIPLENILSNAAIDLGYQIIKDFNSENWIGYGKVQGTVRNGVRESTASEFLNPVKNRSNLFIVKNALVTKVNVVNQVAKGVKVLINGTSIDLLTKKEVIVSAGTVNTPKLLMLSGIGPKDHLAQLNIPVLQDLQVGSNLQDHMVFTGTVFKTGVQFCSITGVSM